MGKKSDDVGFVLLSLPCNVKTITNSGEPEIQIRHHMSNRPMSRLKQLMLIGLLLALSYPWKEVSQWCQWWTVHGNQLSLCLFTPQSSCSFLGGFLIDCFFLGVSWFTLNLSGMSEPFLSLLPRRDLLRQMWVQIPAQGTPSQHGLKNDPKSRLQCLFNPGLIINSVSALVV